MLRRKFNKEHTANFNKFQCVVAIHALLRKYFAVWKFIWTVDKKDLLNSVVYRTLLYRSFIASPQKQSARIVSFRYTMKFSFLVVINW